MRTSSAPSPPRPAISERGNSGNWRRSRPARQVLAVPVAPADSLEELSAECDELVRLAAPDPFYAVGPHYADFRQTEDAEVVRLLAEARQWSTVEPSTPAPG